MLMKRYEIEKPQTLKISEIDLPALAPDEVLIKVAHISICGSDVHLFNGSYKGPFSYPILFGHEWSGTVKAVGSAAAAFRPGEKVTGDCSRFCGTCGICKLDKNLCRNIEKFGITVDGASADYIVRKVKYLYKAPKDIDLMLLSLTEPISVAAHLLRKILRIVDSFEGKKVLLLGGGGIGLSACLLLLERYSCRDVFLFDISSRRMELALECGAEDPGNPFDRKGAEDDSSYGALYSGADYDIVIDTTGSAEVFAKAFHLVKPLGVLGCLGMIPKVEIEQKLIVMKALTVMGSIGGTGEFPEVMDFICRHPALVRKMITHVFPKNKIPEALEMSRKSNEALKICLAFSEEP